jgi:hypothetical protein
VAAFSTRSLKTSIVSIGIEYIKSFMHVNSLGSRSTPHASPSTTQYLCIHYSKINAPFSQNFGLKVKYTHFKKKVHDNFFVLDEICHWLKLKYVLISETRYTLGELLKCGKGTFWFECIL